MTSRRLKNQLKESAPAAAPATPRVSVHIEDVRIVPNDEDEQMDSDADTDDTEEVLIYAMSDIQLSPAAQLASGRIDRIRDIQLAV
jgi:hypothetical protein